MVSSTDVMIPAVWLIVFSCKFDISSFGTVSVNFAPAAFLSALIMGVPFHANFTNVTKLLIL